MIMDLTHAPEFTEMAQFPRLSTSGEYNGEAGHEIIGPEGILH
jgi:hypothetical protein